MKMIALPSLRASSKTRRTRAAPTPANVSTKSEPDSAKNGHPGLAGDGPGQHGLARPGRPGEQEAARRPRPGGGEALRMLEEVADLRQLGHHLVDAADVGEAGVGYRRRDPTTTSERRRARADATAVDEEDRP